MRGKLYSILSGDIGGIKTRSDSEEVTLNVQASVGGLMTNAVVISITYRPTDERPVVSVKLPFAILGEVDYAG